MGATGPADDHHVCSVCLLKNQPLMPRSRTALSSHPGPPPEVLWEIDEAWERAQEALPEGLELDFESEPLLGRAWGVLRLADGTVVEHVGAATAVAIACGDALVATAPAVAV
jgi:hypothetical protein